MPTPGIDGRDMQVRRRAYVPALVAVMSARQELSIAPQISAGQVTGFSLWATRSVLSGRGDEVVDVARTNLRELELPFA